MIVTNGQESGIKLDINVANVESLELWPTLSQIFIKYIEFELRFDMVCDCTTVDEYNKYKNSYIS